MNEQKYFTIESVDYFLCDVFLEYEQPELFTVCNVIGNTFLVMLVDASDEKWLMMPISMAKVCELEYGKIGIREAFLKPEISVSIVSCNNGYYISELISPDKIQEEYLPTEEAKLNWNNNPMPSIQEDLYETASARQRDIFDIRIISDETENHTIDAKKLGALLIIVNDTIKGIAKERNRKAGVKRGLTSGCTLHYLGSYAGSFGIRLEAENYSDLLDETKLTPVLNELFQLLEINNYEDISKMVKEKSFGYSTALRKLLKYSSDNNSGLEFSFVTPRAMYHRSASWKSEFSKNILLYLDRLISEETKEEEYIGNLVSVSTKHSNFIFEMESGEEIKGKIDSSLKETIFAVKSHAKIKVIKTIKITNSKEMEEQFRLTGYEMLS